MYSFLDSVRFNTTWFSGDAWFDHSWVKLDVSDSVVRVWPTAITRAQPGRFVIEPLPPDAVEAAPDRVSEWGRLSYVPTDQVSPDHP